ncbi:hypothetical protein JCM33374_g3199 [Metschnikowia sp. JCM 33374]|nr:hypothetical protein JCM33374_g3199 [Metschnikowia sp. JCM 33374]
MIINLHSVFQSVALINSIEPSVPMEVLHVEYIPGPDPKLLIQQERASASFNIDHMNVFLEGSEEKARETRVFLGQMERDPILAATTIDYDATKAQGNGTTNQMHYWLLQKQAAYVKSLYGCFGMTELAHGSNVAGLETTATFDIEDGSFVVHTPHLGATKWWIGGAAHSATHCSVYARLIVKGRDYGVKTFVVPLRDAGHTLMPGVSIGDIGAKMGHDGIDNGWIQFSHVRSPRYFMLHNKIAADGTVTEPPMNQLSYSALLVGRVVMVKDAFRWSARVVTIAIRYAVGRRQFKMAMAQPTDPESQLLDYPLHQRRLLPILAMTYAFSTGANVLAETSCKALELLDKAVAANDKAMLSAGPVLFKSDLSSPKKVLYSIETALVRACSRAEDVLGKKHDNTDYIGGDLVTLSKLLAHFFLLKAFLDKIEASRQQKDLVPVLDLLAQFYGAAVILEGFFGTFLMLSVVSRDAMAHNSTHHIHHVIPLTDSFMMSDMMINAPIGYYDGDIYQNYFRTVASNNPTTDGKTAYSGAIETMLSRKSVEERHRFENDDVTADALSS